MVIIPPEEGDSIINDVLYLVATNEKVLSLLLLHLFFEKDKQ